MPYNLLMIGGTRDGDIMQMSRLERYYVIIEKCKPEPVVSPSHPDYGRPIKTPKVEYWYRSCYMLSIGDATWEYIFLMESEFAKQRKNDDFIYEYDLSPTFLKRRYLLDYTWNHWPCTNASPIALAR